MSQLINKYFVIVSNKTKVNGNVHATKEEEKGYLKVWVEADISPTTFTSCSSGYN